MNDHSDTTHEKGPAFDEWQVKFIKSLREKGNVSAACRKAKIDRKWAYEKRKGDPFFKQAWDDALVEATEALEEEARRRAVDGVLQPVYYEGTKVGSVRKYSDTLLIVLLKAHAPQKYRENHHHDVSLPPIDLRPDLSKLSLDELKTLKALREKLDGKEDDAVST